MRHSLPYRGRGDIDSVAIAPTGIAFAIETKCAGPRPSAAGDVSVVTAMWVLLGG